MQLTLYSHPLSLFAAKVRIALAAKGLVYQLVDVQLDRIRGYEPKHPEVVRHNPKRQVPVLIADELVLYDSTLILEFLEDIAPEPPLYPRDARQRARCRLLELEADEVFFPPLSSLLQLVYAQASGGSDDAATRARSADAIVAHYARLAGQLGSAEFLCGDLSVADIAHFLVASYAQSLGVPIPAQLTMLGAWFGRIAARPVVAAEILSMQEAAREFRAPRVADSVVTS